MGSIHQTPVLRTAGGSAKMESPFPDFSSDLTTSTLGRLCDEESDEELEKKKHRQSLILMEQSLMVPCDESSISPGTLQREESNSNGASIERLLLERLLLRKELRLRNMQERLLAQEDRIQELEDSLEEINNAPGFGAFFLLSGYCKQTMSGTNKTLEILRIGFKCTLAIIYQALFYMFDLVPTFVTLGFAALIQKAGNLLAQRAENYTNERSERIEMQKKAERRRERNEQRRRR